MFTRNIKEWAIIQRRYDIVSKKTVIIFYGLFSKNQGYDWIPSGPIYIAALLKANGYHPVIIHEYKDRDYTQIIDEYIDDLLIFGVSAMTGYQIGSGIKAVKHLRTYNKEIPVIWGGAHATENPQNTLESSYSDYVYVGPIKNNFIQFLKTIENGSAQQTQINDVLDKNYFNQRQDNSYQIIDYQVDLKSSPDLDLENYDFSYLLTDNRILNYTASIGCPGICSFCSWGGKHPWTSRKLEDVLNDLEFLVKQYNLKSIWLSDSELSIQKEYFLGIAKGLIDRNLNVYWRCNARAHQLSKYTTDEFKLLEESGLDRLFVGLENINEDIQKGFRKIIPAEVIFTILRNIRDYDIQIMLSFIFGNPFGPLSDLEENREFLDKCLDLNQNVRFQVCFYTPYPGSELSKMAIEKGYKNPKTLEEYASDPFFLNTSRSPKRIPWLSEKDSEDYLKRFYDLYPTVLADADWNWRGELY